MNYYERHLGDYARDAGHLTLVEEGAFNRLLDRYYATEKGIPDDQATRVTRSTSKAEKDATRAVLREFFHLVDGVWINNRAEAEIARYRDKQDKARRSAEARWGKTERNTDAMRTHSERYAPRARSSHQSPDTSTATTTQASPETLQRATTAGLACRLMREAGCGGTNPSHPDLLAALAEGVAPEVLADTAREGIADGKQRPFAWAIQTARSRRADGARAVTTASPRVLSTSRQVAGTAGFLGASHAATNTDSDLVLDADRGGPGEPVPPQPRRLPGR